MRVRGLPDRGEHQLTERVQVWRHVGPRVAPYGRFDRIENRLSAVSGIPDVNYCVRAAEGWIENKLGDVENTRPDTLSLAQVRWAGTQAAVGGRYFMLVLYRRPRRTWSVFDAGGVANMWAAGTAAPVLRAVGAFPTVEFLKVITGARSSE